MGTTQNWQEIQDYWNENVFLTACELLDHFGIESSYSAVRHGLLCKNGVYCPRKKGNPHYEKKLKEMADYWAENKHLSAKDIAQKYGTTTSMIRTILKAPKRYHTQKLTEQEAREIKNLCRLGGNQASIARAYGISDTNVSQIKLGQIWANLE